MRDRLLLALGESARSVIETRLGRAFKQAWLSLLSLPVHGSSVVLSFLYFHCNIHSRACRVYQAGPRKFSIRMLVGQQGGWPAPSQGTLPALAFSYTRGRTQLREESREGPGGDTPAIPTQAF